MQNKEIGLATEEKSVKDSVENQLGSGKEGSGLSSTDRKLESGAGEDIFQDFGNDMDIIMENMYENFTKTNNMFSSFGLEMESGLDVIADEDLPEQNENFRKNLLESWKRRVKKVSRG